jgi:hypothetical protein
MPGEPSFEPSLLYQTGLAGKRRGDPGFVLFCTPHLSVWAMIPFRARSKQDLGTSREVDHEWRPNAPKR